MAGTYAKVTRISARVARSPMEISAHAVRIAKTLGYRRAAGYLRNQGIPLDYTRIILLGR